MDVDIQKVGSACPVNVCVEDIAMHGFAEKTALVETLESLGFNVIITNSPIGQNCTVAVTHPGSHFYGANLGWVSAGNGHVQISDWGSDYITNVFPIMIPQDQDDLFGQPSHHKCWYNLLAWIAKSWTTIVYWNEVDYGESVANGADAWFNYRMVAILWNARNYEF